MATNTANGNAAKKARIDHEEVSAEKTHAFLVILLNT